MEKKHNIQPMSVLPNQLISLFTHTRFFVIFSGFSRSKRKVHYSITLLPWLMKTWRLNILYVAVHFTQLCTLPIIVSQWVYAALGPKSEDLRFLYSMSEKLLCVCVCVCLYPLVIQFFPTLTDHVQLVHSYQPCTWIFWRTLNAKAILTWSEVTHILLLYKKNRW